MIIFCQAKELPQNKYCLEIDKKRFSLNEKFKKLLEPFEKMRLFIGQDTPVLFTAVWTVSLPVVVEGVVQESVSTTSSSDRVDSVLLVLLGWDSNT